MAVTIKALCERHHVDMAHARHVAKMSLALYDALAGVHRLPKSCRRLMEAAAILHNIAYAEDAAHHDTVGRDLILANSIAGFSADERTMLACTTRFHRKKARPQEEPAFQTLPPHLREQTLALAALLRVGDAFDYSSTQTSRLLAIELAPESVRLVVDGAHANEEAARANKKADLWNSLFDRPLTVLTAAQAHRESDKGEKAAPPKKTGSTVRQTQLAISADDPIAEAGAKVLRRYFSWLKQNEPGARKGRDIEALHRMRTASRRLRATMRLFGPYLPAKQERRMAKRLRRLTRALGPVRDLDVQIERVKRYGKELPKAKRATLAPLLKFLRKQRVAARRKMLRYFNGRQYGDLQEACKELLDAEHHAEAARAAQLSADPKPRGDLIRHVAPSLIWDHYQCVRAYETILDKPAIETLHALRIECKRLRYTLELLQEALGKPAKAAIREVRRMQDFLGELHDADVAAQMVGDFLERRRRQKKNASAAEAVHDYLEVCKAEVQEALQKFPRFWAHLNSAEFRRLLAEITAAL
ncbi:MAG: CHAD domain-containing protein [Candidatus Sumerlaeia bacterium]|nr:CHAD domain-containing protein [Candidatus Sumerlaeia bacterium]